MEEQLFDLLSTKSFEALSENERVFVLNTMTESEYRTQYKVFSALENAKTIELVPQPLHLPEKNKTRIIPLWQALVGAAACFLIGFFIFSRNVKPATIALVKYLPAKKEVDTIFLTKYTTIEKEKLVNDNVVQIVHDTIRIQEKYIQTEDNVAETKQSNPPKSVISGSAKEDQDLGWVPKRIQW